MDNLCFKCDLCTTRVNMVRMEGSGESGLVVIGEAPGITEDKKARPFVGRSGKLLKTMIKGAGFNVNSVAITNVVKCRPPGNRAPSYSEIEQCFPILNKEINSIPYKIYLIVTLGNVATNTIIKLNGISKNRGELFKRGKYIVMPMFHPSYVLRNGEQESFKEDWIKVSNYFKNFNPYHTHNF